MSWEYSENKLVQDSAGNLLQNELQWDVKYAFNQEILGENGTLGRKSYREILLKRYVKEALKRLNAWITPVQIDEALNILERRLSTSELIQINEEKYSLIRDGIDVSIKNAKGDISTKKALLIDFNNPDNNYFLAVKELKIHGEIYRRRTDIVGFVNGIPLLFVELKNHNVEVSDAYYKNYTDYLDTIPQLFYYNAFLMVSNGHEAKVGTLESKWDFFHEWKRLKEEDAGNVELATMLRYL
jgi:type I restriction enzyme R subunit